MINLKEETLRDLGSHTIVAAQIFYTPDFEHTQEFRLSVGHTPQELEEFLNSLDFNYDNGYGIDYVHGNIWCEDGYWLSRVEYDGSENWASRQYKIPNELK